MSSRLRYVVESLLELLDDFGINEEIVSISHENIVHRESLKTERTLAILRKAKSALAEPLRNCDVGSEYEQSERFGEFCRHHQKGCGLGYGSKGIGHPKVTCPAFKNIECSVVWSQMPYEEVKE